MGPQPWRIARTPMALALTALVGALAWTRGVVAPRLEARSSTWRARAAEVPPAPRPTGVRRPAEPESPRPEAVALLDAPTIELAVPAAPLRGPALRPELRVRSRGHGTSRAGGDEAAPPTTSRLARSAGGWVLDLRGLSNPAEPFFGAFLTPTGGSGFELRSLDRNGYLAAVGARVGDVLLAVNDRPTLTADEVLSVVASQQRATAVSLRVRRGSVQYRLAVELLR